MPFGQKPDAGGNLIDFDAVYSEILRPAIEVAGFEPIRADEELTGGVIHKAMYERLILCDFAIADLTTANANVFYELGVRHAVRPSTTLSVFAKDSRLPFDVNLLRAIPYGIGAQGRPNNAADMVQAIGNRLKELRRAAKDGPLVDSPIFQLLHDYPKLDVEHLKTDNFRDQVSYSAEMKRRIAAARDDGKAALDALRGELQLIAERESGVVIDLFLSYRAVKGWQEMVDLVGEMSKPLSESVMIQEQLALALNRLGQGDEAERIIREVIAKKGPSSESYGILGRILKDRWEAAAKAGKEFEARGLLQKAIDAYTRGFEADSRDAYPGINAVTLMELREPPDERQKSMLPVVVYAVNRRMATGKPDYWDWATRVELDVLSSDRDRAAESLGNALANVREVWEPETTLRNLRLIREARERRGVDVGWMREIEAALEAKGKEMESR